MDFKLTKLVVIGIGSLEYTYDLGIRIRSWECYTTFYNISEVYHGHR